MGWSPCGIPGSGWGLHAFPGTPQPGAVPEGLRGLAPLHLPPCCLHCASGEVVGLVCGACWSPGCRGAGPECVPLVSSRVGQRGSGLSMSAARSEHEVSEIIDGLSEQEVRARL